jgi:hypothetical protein
MGEPMASHSERRRQIVEKDFSPPERVFVWRPAAEVRVISGSTCNNISVHKASDKERAYLDIQSLRLMSEQKLTPKLPLTQQIGKTSARP